MAIEIPGPDSGDEDPVVARLTAQEEARTARLNGSLTQAITTNPDQFAGRRKVAQDLGYPDAVVEAMPHLAQQAQVDQIKKNVANSPALSRNLADDEAFAKLAHDDTQNLSAVERTINITKNVGRSIYAALPGFNEGVYGALQSAADLGSAATGKILPIDPFGALSEVINERRIKEKGFKTTLEKARGDVGSTEGAIYSGIESGTQNLMLMPLAVLTRNPNLLAGTMATQTGGQSYGDAIDAGKTPGQALPFAVSQGVVEYATEQIPALKLLDGLKAKAPVMQVAKDFLAKEIPGEQVATALQDLNEWAVLNPDKPFAEYLKARPEAAYQTLVATIVGGSVQVGAGKAIEAVAGRFAPQDEAANLAQQHREAFAQLDGLAKSSLLRARDPATFQQFIASAAEDGPVQDVYVDAKVLNDSGVLNQLAQVSPAVREQYNEAATTGGTVRIPMEEFATHIAGTELSQPLLDHIKLDPNGMTFAESEQFQQNYQSEFNQQVAQATQQYQGDEAFKTSTNEVKALVKDQLNIAGHTSPSVNDTYATMASSYYAVRAAQLGITPKELYDQHPLTVTGESLNGGQFNQTDIGKSLADKIKMDPAAAIAEYSQLPDTDGGRVLNTDEARELSPEYRADRSRSTEVHEASSQFIKELYTQKLAQPVSEGRLPLVLFTAGGTGAGKSTSRQTEEGQTLFQNADLIYDTNMNSYDSAVSKIEAALASGRDVAIQYTFRDPVDALVAGALPRAMRMGRTVPLNAHADTHTGVSKVIPMLQAKYADDERVSIEVIDNSRGKGNQQVVKLDELPKVDENQLLEKLNEALNTEYQAGRISDTVYNGTKEQYTQLQGVEPQDGGGSSSQPSNPNQLLNQGATGRGSYSPESNTISLLKNADLSTFLHELGHAFLAMDTQMATQLLASGENTEGSSQLLADTKTLLDWFGIEGELQSQLNTWNGMSVDEQRASHEKLAEAFESYLFEGKAPSLALQPVFQRIRAWMTNVYRTMKEYLAQAGETLTPEVRAVFDRMLATADQIKEQQQARGIAPLFQNAEEAGMDAATFAKYQQDNILSSQDAISELEARSLKDMTWTSRLKERTVARLNKEANTLRKEVRKQVEAEVDQEPVYAAMRFLKRGETVGKDGEQIKVEAGHRLSISGLEQIYPPGELTDHPDYKRLGYGGYGMLAADGLHPDLVAEMFGFASGDDLVRTLLDAQPRNMVVDAVTDQRMLEQHGELAGPEAIGRAADEAIHNDVRTRVLSTELAGLQKALGSALVLSRMAKDYARIVVGKTKIKELRPNKFATDAARAGKQADAAMRKGNREEAVIQKRNQLINHTTTKAAYEAQAEVRKTILQFRKIASAKTDNLKSTHNMDLVNAARAVLAEYGVGTRTQNPREYIDLIKEYDPELYAALEPDIIQAQQNAKDIQLLTVDELRGLRDQVESLWYLARREKQIEIDGKMVARETVVGELSERLDELGLPATVPGEGRAVTEADKRGRYLRGLRAALRRVEAWVDRMDGGNTRGVFRNYLFTPISEAADRYRIDAGKTVTQFRDLLKQIEPSLRPGRIAAPELNYTFGYSKGDAGMSELLHAIAHTGNESNKRKLLLGRNWATELPDGALDTQKWDGFVQRMIDEGRLTKEHFDFVQGVWDLLEQTKPLAQKTHREVFGRYFAAVTADEFTNQFGTYRGGYVPAITDTFEVQDAAINAALEDVNAGNAYMFPSTSRGFTKSRVEYNRPLALDLRLLPQHLDKVILFAHMERHVRDVQRVLKKVQGKLNRYDPVAYTDLLLPWLNRAAKQVVQTPSAGTAGKAMDKFLSAARSRAGMATMFANLTNALQQITGFSITLLKVKPTHLRQAMATYIKSSGEMADAAAELSPFMKERLENQTFHLRGEIEDMLLNPGKYEQAKNWTQKHAYFLQSMFQNVVDTVSWTAAYNQHLAEGMTDKEAIRAANAAVRQTQGSLKPEDISSFEAGSAFKRAFTQFASYFNMQANVLGTEFATISQELGFKKGAGKAFYVFLFGFLVPCWVSEAIVRGMRGGGGDGDDEYLDEWLSFIFGAPLRNVAAMVPIAGPVMTRVASGFTPQQYDDRMATAPAISALESAANAPSSVYKAMFEDGRIKNAIKDSLTLVAMLTGVPVNTLGKPLGYMADVSQGKVKPTSTGDAVRGLISGVPSEDSKR